MGCQLLALVKYIVYLEASIEWVVYWPSILLRLVTGRKREVGLSAMGRAACATAGAVCNSRIKQGRGSLGVTWPGCSDAALDHHAGDDGHDGVGHGHGGCEVDGTIAAGTGIRR